LRNHFAKEKFGCASVYCLDCPLNNILQREPCDFSGAAGALLT